MDNNELVIVAYFLAFVFFYEEVLLFRWLVIHIELAVFGIVF